jgi:hypothetical protein
VTGAAGTLGTVRATMSDAGTPSDAPKRGLDDDLEFGPSGYLPERASKRARKIVLRAPLGAQWIVAAVVAGVAVIVAGVWFLATAGDPPPEPWVAVGAVDELPAAEPAAVVDALVVTAGGRIRAFAEAIDVRYCAPSNRLEAPDGRVWSLTGRGFGTASLAEHPTLTQDGIAYVDPTRTSPGPDPDPETVEPGCA